MDNMDIIRNNKKLLDAGIITQEEFDKRADELLNGSVAATEIEQVAEDGAGGWDEVMADRPYEGEEVEALEAEAEEPASEVEVQETASEEGVVADEVQVAASEEEEVNEETLRIQREETEARELKAKAKRKKMIIAGVVALFVLAIAGAIGANVQTSHYEALGAEQFEAGNYYQAAVAYDTVLLHNHDAEIEACCNALIDQEDMASAREVIKMVQHKSDEGRLMQSYLDVLYNLSNMDEVEITDISDVEDLLSEFDEYLADLYELGDYKSSKYYYNVVCALVGEGAYESGMLNTAKKYFSMAESGFEVEGINVDQRLDTLNRYDAFVRMCGRWVSTRDNALQSKCITIYTGYENWWDMTRHDETKECEIYCYIQDDGSVIMEGHADFLIPGNFDTESANLYTNDYWVDLEHSCYDLSGFAPEENVWVSFGDCPKVEMSWLEQPNFTYKYRYSTTWIFNQRLEAY